MTTAALSRYSAGFGAERGVGAGNLSERVVTIVIVQKSKLARVASDSGQASPREDEPAGMLTSSTTSA
ncbi:hypothetical protein SAMN05421854_108247 [Amycolatopsis rubida]|uniref:Uncharacterized protein n=1 Tax=Amycolatopsis rubida TaxID=112413 RepID=A0A1I5V915_9PSEU|nr:hypothetical protein SAMN05421854_108247 [Amycolatopsis rubida]